MKSLILAIFFGILCSTTIYAEEKKIILAGDVWMPYSGDGKISNGYHYDIAKHIFEKNGYKVEYTAMPWNRIKEEFDKTNVSGFVGLTEDDDTVKDFYFPKNTFGMGQIAFYVKNGVKWKFKGESSLLNVNFGVAQDYAYDELDAYIEKNKENKTRITLLPGADASDRLLEMLIAGRVDVVDMDMAFVDYTMKVKNINKDLIEMAGKHNSPFKVTIGFSKIHPQAQKYAKMLSDGLMEMRKNGELKKILDNYGMSDWVKKK